MALKPDSLLTRWIDRAGGHVFHRQIIAAAMRSYGEIRLTDTDRSDFRDILRSVEVFHDTETGDTVLRRARAAEGAP